MAPPSPRRSSRARTANTLSQHSSVSSGTSGRLERNTRSVNKPASGKSTPSASLSSEPLDDAEDTLLGRRRKRAHDEDQDRPARNDASGIVNDADDFQEDEDEAVRCICGSEEYPGRPPVDGPDADFFASIELTEDVTGFFVQCDVCKVWQHGACVGIFSAESSPDEYFCEQCRKDLHKIHSAGNGQKYSKYLPLNRPSRTTSRATSIAKEGARSPKLAGSKTTRPNTTSQTSKRRSTMNSRDAAYDDEQLRRAIEASKEETVQETADNDHMRRMKRGRSNSEENSTHAKRQRTSSRSVSPAIKNTDIPSREESDDETSTRGGQKKPHPSKSQDRSEKEERERTRQEASSKRKGRAERRRTEDSDLSEEMPLALAKAAAGKSVETSSTTEPIPVVIPVPGTPPAAPLANMSAHKRSSRSTHKKGKGRNQYTKDRGLDHEESPARSMSRDIAKATDESTAGGSAKPTSDPKHGSKAKVSGTNKMSMLDMKRRVAAIMDFISKTQIDLATEAPFNGDGPLTTRQAQSSEKPKALLASSSDRNNNNNNNNNNSNSNSNNSNDDDNICSKEEQKNDIVPESSDAKGFKELSCIEMMDVLTRDMVRWQSQYS